MLLNKLAKVLTDKGLTLCSVESCTGGGIGYQCTDVAGSSLWYVGGVITYSNEMKIMLGVDPSAIKDNGAVSQQVVEQMAISGLAYCQSDWAVSVSGVAGPGGGSPEKPVGTVWFGWAGAGTVISEMVLFSGNRQQVREQTISHALAGLLELVNK